GDPTQPQAFQSTGELERQINMAKRNSKEVGSAMYSAKYILQNQIGITNKLADLYKDPSVPPFVGRATAAEPATPTNVRIEGNTLKWNAAPQTRSVVYYFPPGGSGSTREGKVLAILTGNSLDISQSGGYVVSSLNVDHKESNRSEIVEKN